MAVLDRIINTVSDGFLGPTIPQPQPQPEPAWQPEPVYQEPWQQYQDWQQGNVNDAQAIAENQLYSNYAMSGFDPNTDPLFQQNLQQIRNMDTVPTVYSDIKRRLDTAPFEWNLLGFTSQQKTPEPARNLYDAMFMQEDQAQGPKLPAFNLQNGVVRQSDIDDGSSPDSRESLMMTGEQYIKYRDKLGLPGRDVNEIDPDEIYNKQDEQDNYGFIPYLTSNESVDRFHDASVPHAVSNIFNNLADARRTNTDFDVSYDGKTMSGHDLIRQGKLWQKRNAGTGADAELFTDESMVTEDSVPYTYALTDSNGDTITAKSALVNSFIDEQDRPVMQFEDGDVWTFDDMDDYNRSLSIRPSREDDFTMGWKNLEPLVLDDGTKLRADQAEELLSDSNYQNYADYGPANWSNPYIEDPFQDRSGNFNLNPMENSFLPWITDVALGSLPYFFMPTAGAQGTANALAADTGFQPGRQDFLDGTYSMLSDDPTEAQRNAAVIGSALTPITEQLWGPLGGKIGKGIGRAFGRAEKVESPLVRYGKGIIGEGMEEIPGNLTEELMAGNDPSRYFANQLYRDAEGNLTTENTGTVAYDSQGTPIVDTDTDVISRLRNFASDIPLSFIGGATLGAGLGAARIPQYRSEYAPIREEREEFGNNMVIPDYDGNLAVKLTDEERDFYNR